MNYGITIMSVAVLDVLAVLSGLPTSWKKIVVIGLSVVLIFIGWTIRIVERRRALRAKARAAGIEAANSQDFSRVATTIAHDVEVTVEHEIETLAHGSDYHPQ